MKSKYILPSKIEQKTREGFLWSLMSEKNGGFVCGRLVTNVFEVEPGLLSGTVEHLVDGKTTSVDGYEFFEEQFIERSTDIFNIPDMSSSGRSFRKGQQVIVYARQVWGDKLSGPIPGVVYQDTIEAGRYYDSPGSVIVSVDPRKLKNPHINSVGGTTLEVYPQQLRVCYHNIKYPISGAVPARFSGGKFVLHKAFRSKPSSFWKRLFGS